MATRNGKQSASEAQQPSPRRPFKELRCGGLKAVVWENETRAGAMFSTQLVRVYKDDNDDWKETHSLGFDDLLSAGKLLDMAHTTVLREMQSRSERQRQQAEAA
jgi:hypothetical protein